MAEEKECDECKVAVPLRIMKEICSKSCSTPDTRKCDEEFGKVLLGETTVDEFYKNVKKLIPLLDIGAHITLDNAMKALNEVMESGKTE